MKLTNLTNLSKLIQPNLSNQNYQTRPTKSTKPNLPNQTYKTNQSKPTKLNQTFKTKISKGTKSKHQNLIHEPNWHIQTTIKARQVKACPELGTAQPQLVSVFFLNYLTLSLFEQERSVRISPEIDCYTFFLGRQNKKMDFSFYAILDHVENSTFLPICCPTVHFHQIFIGYSYRPQNEQKDSGKSVELLIFTNFLHI